MRLWKKVFLIATIIEVVILTCGFITYNISFSKEVWGGDALGHYVVVTVYPYRELAIITICSFSFFNFYFSLIFALDEKSR